MSDPNLPAATPVPPSRADFAAVGTRLAQGRWANADLYLVTHCGMDWIMKDFSRCPWFYRWTVGRWMVGRELRALHQLAGLDGIARYACRIDAYALAYEFQPGIALAKLPRQGLPLNLFTQLESLVLAMHARGIAHLDLRNSGNVLIRPDGRPAVLDFQSHMPLPEAPHNPWRRLLVAVDLSGVYKLWQKRLPGTLSPEQETLLQRVNGWRRLWFVRGYAGIRIRRKKKPRE